MLLIDFLHFLFTIAVFKTLAADLFLFLFIYLEVVASHSRPSARFYCRADHRVATVDR
jgi:hypothetical protein